MANIGNLSVLLSLDAAAFAAGLDRADKGLKSFAVGVSVATAGVGLAMTAIESVGKAGFGWITGGIDDLAALGRQSKELGIDVERLSGLQFAAGRSGEEMEGAFKHLNLKLAEAASGSKAARDEFARFGLDGAALAQGGLSNAVDAIADKMHGMSSAAERAAIAQGLMSRSAQSLIPFLEKGSAAIRQMETAAGQLGGIVTTAEVERAIAAQESMDHLWATLKGVQRTVAAEIAPYVTAVGQAFEGWLKGVDIKQKIQDGFGWLENQIPVVISGIAELTKGFLQVGVVIDKIAAKFGVLAEVAADPRKAGLAKGKLEAIDMAADLLAGLENQAVDVAAKSAIANIHAALESAKKGAASAAGAPVQVMGQAALNEEEIKRITEGQTAGLNIFDQYTTKLAKLQEAFGDAAKTDLRFRNAVEDLNVALEKSSASKLAESLNDGASAVDKLKAKYEELVGIGLDKASPAAFAADLAKSYKELAGSAEKINHSGAALEGSKEDYSVRLHAEQQDRPADVQAQVKAGIDRLVALQQKQEQINQRIADAIERIFKKG